MPPRASVLIPTYNRAQFLLQCLESVLQQTWLPSQIIVINDGSTDNTREILQAYLGRIDYLEQENAGKPAAVNLGLPRVTGEYVWIMDDDDVALPDALERHLTLLEQRPEVGFTYSSCILAETRPRDGRLVPTLEKLLPEIPEEEFFLRLLERGLFAQPAMVVRAACYQAVGPFDGSLLRAEDYEMTLRLARRFRAARVQGPTYYRRKHAGLRGTASDPLPLYAWAERSRAYKQGILRRLRQELDLTEYLPSSFGKSQPSPVDTRRAYLQRMTVMGSHGLTEEMLEDLRAALSSSGEARPLSPSEQAILIRLVGNLPPQEESFFQVSFLERIRALTPGPLGRSIRGAMTRGLCRRALWVLKRKAWRDAFRSARAAFRLGGLRGVGAVLARKLGRAPAR